MRFDVAIFYAVWLCLSAVACGQSSDSDSLRGTELTLKIQQRTGENPFAKLSYACNACSLGQFLTLEAPQGWQKAPAQLILPNGELENTLSLEGVASTIDVLSEIPGAEFELIAKSINGRLVQIDGGVIMAVVSVMRDTIFRFPTNSRVHELTAPDGEVYVLFAYEVKTEVDDIPDFAENDALMDYPMPTGWTYSNRILDDELVMRATGTTTVLSIQAARVSTWQRRESSI